MSPGLTPICMQLLCRALLFALFLPACVSSKHAMMPSTFTHQSSGEIVAETNSVQLKQALVAEDVLLWPTDINQPEMIPQKDLANRLRKELEKSNRFNGVKSMRQKSDGAPLRADQFSPLQLLKNGNRDLAFRKVRDFAPAKLQMLSTLQFNNPTNAGLLKMNLKAQLWDRTEGRLLWQGEANGFGTPSSRKKMSQALTASLFTNIGTNKALSPESIERHATNYQLARGYQNELSLLTHRAASRSRNHAYTALACVALWPITLLVSQIPGAIESEGFVPTGPGSFLIPLVWLSIPVFAANTVIAGANYIYYRIKHSSIKKQFKQAMNNQSEEQNAIALKE